MTLALTRHVVWMTALAALAAAPARAQAPLQLADLHRAAAEADPRMRQLALETRHTDLRLQTIDAERRPSLGVEGRAQHQSDVATTPLFAPPRNTVDAYVTADQRIVDPGRTARREVARAALEETRARIATALYSVRAEVNDVYFGALDAQARVTALDARVTALEALLQVAEARVREGAALPGEARAIEATLIDRRRDRDALEARRRAAVVRLSQVTGGAAAAGATLPVPDLAAAVADAREQLPAARQRPEFTQFARARDRLDAEQAVVDAAGKPRVGAFLRLGYGRPGLNFIADQWDTYWLGGVQVQWAPSTWGAAARDRESLSLRREIVAAEEAAFAARLARAATADLADIDRLDAMLVSDARSLALREAVEREARIRWEARVIPLQEYLDRTGELLDAELALASHRVELAAARARVLTTLGLEAK